MQLFLLPLIFLASEIRLPPVEGGEMPLEEAIKRRRSVRSFTERELTLKQLSQLLWASQGITDSVRGFRSAPSAGALYPLKVYLVKKDGVFEYIPSSHSIVKRVDGDKRGELCRTALWQSFIEEAPVSFVITAVYERTTVKYRERGIRYVHIEVGHSAQNIHLEAVALGLASVPVGAFRDDEVKKVLSLPPSEEPLYIIPVGYARGQ
jgi:SagB-type dehydrogenase family enzyme